MKLYIINEGHTCYAYSTTGKHEDVVFINFAFEQDDVDCTSVNGYPQAWVNWKGLIARHLGQTWEELEVHMDALGMDAYPDRWNELAERQMELEGYTF